ncbi:helix-turn-helix domain-containing protein [Paenibacillus elgii]
MFGCVHFVFNHFLARWNDTPRNRQRLKTN